MRSIKSLTILAVLCLASFSPIALADEHHHHHDNDDGNFVIWFGNGGYDYPYYYPYGGYYPYPNSGIYVVPQQYPVYHHHASVSVLIVQVQQRLADLGYYKGDIDGISGPQTQAALTAYQKDKGLKQTGTADADTLQSLGIVNKK